MDAPLKSFFKLSKPLSYLIILSSAYCLGLSVYAPHWITWHCGPLGQLAIYLAEAHFEVMRGLFLFGVGLHLFETAIALYYCRKNNLDMSSTVKWIVQTTLLGIFSLYMLIAYSNNNSKNKNTKSKKKGE